MSPRLTATFSVDRARATHVKPYERQALLDRIDREGATIGVTIPERLHLEDGSIALRERVFELQAAGPETASERDAVDGLRRELRRARRSRVEQLESAQINREADEELVETIVGIDRALGVLDDIGTEEDIEARMRDQERADQERWMNFLKRALGQSNEGAASRGGRR